MSKISGKMITSVSAVALAAATLAFSASAAFDQDSAGAEEAASTKAAVVTDAIALDGEGTLLFDYVADVNGTEASGEDVTYVTEASPRPDRRRRGGSRQRRRLCRCGIFNPLCRGGLRRVSARFRAGLPDTGRIL